MTIKEYENLAMRTNDGNCTRRVIEKLEENTTVFSNDMGGYIITATGENLGELLNGALGLTGEAGEVSDAIKKFIFHGHELDRDALVKELGDVCWYIAILCHAIDVPLEEVMIRNIEKLKKRYPEGFSETASINRTE